MGVEIERKFTVRADFCPQSAGTEIAQGYLSRDPQRTVRVRMAGARGYLTVKGVTHGASRAEYEYEIPPEDARAMLALCDPPLVEKTRYVMDAAGRRWEVDVFHGANAGLVVAEVELPSETAEVTLPEWVECEVTGEKRYYNSALIVHPYRCWTSAEKGKYPPSPVDK